MISNRAVINLMYISVTAWFIFTHHHPHPLFRMKYRLAYISLCIFFFHIIDLQRASAQQTDRCGTMQLLTRQFNKDINLKNRFFESRRKLDSIILEKQINQVQQASALSVSIPVVFHIVLKDPSVVKDADILKQLDVLNTSFAGLNADTALIPSWFKPLLGKSSISFCLAQRTPDDEASNGIARYTTSVDSFYIVNDNIKYASSGGADAWNTTEYMNVWVCEIGNGITGFSTLPGTSNPDEQGVVINVHTLPGGSLTRFNEGKTLVHETGHYLNLMHVWGDDNGGCTGTDFIDDTPNQAGSSSGVITGIKTDNCTTSGNGIMYQNYMDYTDDVSLLMFTLLQVTRMEESITMFRSSLLSSRGCAPLVQFSTDAEIKNISLPENQFCASSFVPRVRLRNMGSAILNSLNIHLVVNQQPISTFHWTGTLASLESTEISFAAVTVNFGNQLVSVFSDAPNNSTDDDRLNDTLNVAFTYDQPRVLPLREGFETLFPPAGWQLINPDQSFTWQLSTEASKTGNASVMMKHFSYPQLGEKDQLQLPVLDLDVSDSAFLTFQVAAAAYNDLETPGHIFDSLKVMVSIDCGKSFKQVYRKSGKSLVTRQQPVEENFVPVASDWRKDSVDLGEFIGQQHLMIRFETVNAFGNNIYIDDVEVYSKPIDSRLREKGYVISPNPASSFLVIKFFPEPQDLQAIQLYALTGQKVKEIKSGFGYTYQLDLRNLPAGMYILRLVYAGKTITEKILKK